MYFSRLPPPFSHLSLNNYPVNIFLSKTVDEMPFRENVLIPASPRVMVTCLPLELPPPLIALIPTTTVLSWSVNCLSLH